MTVQEVIVLSQGWPHTLSTEGKTVKNNEMVINVKAVLRTPDENEVIHHRVFNRKIRTSFVPPLGTILQFGPLEDRLCLRFRVEHIICTIPEGAIWLVSETIARKRPEIPGTLKELQLAGFEEEV